MCDNKSLGDLNKLFSFVVVVFLAYLVVKCGSSVSNKTHFLVTKFRET